MILTSQYSPEVADVGCVMLCRVGADTEPASNVLKMETPITVEPGACCPLMEASALRTTCISPSYVVLPS